MGLEMDWVGLDWVGLGWIGNRNGLGIGIGIEGE
jgi:hypothetical protein